MFKKMCLVLLLVSAFLAQSYAQEPEEVVFSGIPVVKISEGGASRVVEDVKGEKAMEAECTITKVGGKYLWKTRNNVEFVLIQSGAYMTFVATSGAGYVRVIPPNMKEAAVLGAAVMHDEAEIKYDYVEHMLIGLRSVTYYGKSK